VGLYLGDSMMAHGATLLEGAPGAALELDGSPIRLLSVRVPDWASPADPFATKPLLYS